MMKRIAAISLLVLLGFTACSRTAPVSAADQKAALQQVVNKRFDWSSVPAEREPDFYAIVSAFSADRHEREFVSAVKFLTNSEVDLWFSDGGMHGGGIIHAKKVNGKWVIAEKAWFV